jgi:hypothetical protein
MTQIKTEQLNEAISALKLVDITLLNADFDRPSPQLGPIGGYTQQEFREVVYRVFEGDLNGGFVEGKRLFVIVKFGVRLVREPEEAPASEPESEGVDEPDLEVLVRIQANYIVQYEMVAEPSEESLQAFGKFNAVHNVWPFWRQHVFDIVQRGSLPKVDIPLFSG